MRPTTFRLFRETARILNISPSITASSTTTTSSSSRLGSCETSTKTTSIGGRLGPIVYHIFEEPLPYNVGLKLQNDLIDLRLDKKVEVGKSNDIILFLGRRDNSLNPDTLHPEEKKVQNVGAEFYITKRGGQVTYHGPGQLVGYPILDLNVMETPTKCYVDWLQALLADYVRDQGCKDILAPHPQGHVGIFASPTEKVASIGIHLRHRITSHGFAMNITPEPVKWFDLVMACGLADVHAVSLQDFIRKSTPSTSSVGTVGLPSVRDVARGLVPRFGKVFGREMKELTPGVQGVEGEDGELEAMWGLVNKAEEDARRINGESGGWASEPDLSKRPTE